MKKAPILFSILLAFGCASLATATIAAPLKKTTEIERIDEATPVASDTRLVVFNYDPNLVYNINAQDSMFTHIELRPGEKVLGFYLSDTTRWRFNVSKDAARVFIKPTLPGLFNSATMVTSVRTYELTFRSVKENQPWYQRVRWNINDENQVSFDQATGVYEDIPQAGGGLAGMMNSQAKNPVAFDDDVSRSEKGGGDSGSDIPTIRPDKINFGYKVEGEASFKPTSVFDDGKFTWVQISGSQTLPAVFHFEKGSSEVQVIDYTVHGDFLLISRLVDGLLLKLGKNEVRITRGEKCSSIFGCKE